MIKSTASALALILGMLSGLASAQITYVGSTTIGESLIPEAAKAFTAKTSIPYGSIEMPDSSKGLEMILRGEAQLAGISRSRRSRKNSDASTTGSSATTLSVSMCTRPIQ